MVYFFRLVFSPECRTSCEIASILSFLKYTRQLLQRISVGKHDLVVKFLRGSRRLNPPRPNTVPPWDLSVVLKALNGPPVKPLTTVDLRPLSLKSALLLALASVKRIGDLQALSVDTYCLEFGPNDTKVVLSLR